jgi:hypothetical protein
MSKQSQTGLTGSRKKTRGGVAPVDCLDGLRDCLENIGTLAGLLEAAGRHSNAEFLKPDMVSRTGKLILAETAKAEAWLEQLEAAR